MPYKIPTFRDAPRPLTVERALFLLAEEALKRQSAEFDLELIGSSLVDDLQHKMQEHGAKQFI